MEREILFTGIGGQSVQLATQVLAHAAVLEEREVMMLGTYGGTMRGGSTASTLVVGDEGITSPPIVSGAWSAIAMHHAFWTPVETKLRSGGIVVLNSPVFDRRIDRDDLRVFSIPATAIADGIGAPLSASMVLVAAYARITGLVGVESLVEGMRASVPAYRRQHLDANANALRAGFESTEANVAPAWGEERAA